jgi:hydrogenase expression/formation protein HypD
MEVRGGQTHTLVRQGIDELLPAGMRMIHGPGCPVCVTPLETLDRAMAIAARPGVILTSFGDMLRVPGTRTDLLSLRAPSADVRVVYAPMDAVRLAAAHPDREVVFLAVGFETTAPANAAAVLHAARLGLPNFSVLVSHVLVPPAMTALLDDPDCEVQAFLAAGHVCAVMGWREYEPIAARYRVPIVVTGFEPLDLLEGILMAVRQLESGRHEVENQYARAVRRPGNTAAQDLVRRVFRVTDRAWRGLGPLPGSGLGLTREYAAFDAARRFDAGGLHPVEDPECVAGAILPGARLPTDCAAYGTRCTPRRPLGAPMVSSEGTCAAFHAAGRRAAAARPGDAVLLSGPVGLHGTTVLSTREGLGFEGDVASDTRPLHRLVAALAPLGGAVHTLRDPTRGGLAAALNEIARDSSVAVEIEERAVPVPEAVAAACDLLGLDPLVVANEGCLVAFVAAPAAGAALAALRSRPEGSSAVRIGEVLPDSSPGRVTLRTLAGARRIVELPLGEQLPRIC